MRCAGAFERHDRRRPRFLRRTIQPLVLAMVVGCGAVGCGGFPHESPARSLESSLRGDAQEAPAGKHAYWLGPSFRGSHVTSVSGSWGDQVAVTYSFANADGSPRISLDVISFARQASPDKTNAFSTQIHLTSDQDVQIRVRWPAHPSERFIRDARSAIRKIPNDVEYAGSQS
jgi:hypothetical protein